VSALGKRIKEARRLARLTQAALAEKVGVAGKSSVAKWEAGDREPDQVTLRRIAEVTGCSVAFLLGESKEGPTPPSEPDWKSLKQAIDDQRVAFVAAVESQRKEYNDTVKQLTDVLRDMKAEIKGLRADLETERRRDQQKGETDSSGGAPLRMRAKGEGRGRRAAGGSSP
jgi:transcriptional regulator with XRE-family HTH domain